MLNLIWKKSTGFMPDVPQEVDKTSSPTTVYLRRNIKEVTNEEGDNTHWEYEEAQLTVSEYVEYLEQMNVVKSLAMQRLMYELSELELVNMEAREQATEERETLAQMVNDLELSIAEL